MFQGGFPHKIFLSSCSSWWQHPCLVFWVMLGFFLIIFRLSIVYCRKRDTGNTCCNLWWDFTKVSNRLEFVLQQNDTVYRFRNGLCFVWTNLFALTSPDTIHTCDWELVKQCVTCVGITGGFAYKSSSISTKWDTCVKRFDRLFELLYVVFYESQESDCTCRIWHSNTLDTPIWKT